MKTFAEVISRWPSPAEFASDIGVRPNHVQTMKVRESIPPEYWSDLVRCAARRRIRGVTMNLLGQIAKSKRRAQRIPA